MMCVGFITVDTRALFSVLVTTALALLVVGCGQQSQDEGLSAQDVYGTSAPSGGGSANLTDRKSVV